MYTTSVARSGPRLARSPSQLPPGRHGLSRSFVARNQRERILAAVAEATCSNGYASLKVQDIVTRAGVSRRTFYEFFDNKDEAFLAAYDEGAGRLLSSVRAAYQHEPTFPDRVTALFGAFLDILVASPTFAQMCIVEVMAAGPKAIARRTRVMEEFALAIEDSGRELLGERSIPGPLVAETIVGGVCEAVYRRIGRDETHELPALLPVIVESVVLQYLGEQAAADYRRSR